MTPQQRATAALASPYPEQWRKALEAIAAEPALPEVGSRHKQNGCERYMIVASVHRDTIGARDEVYAEGEVPLEHFGPLHFRTFFKPVPEPTDAT